MLRNHYLGELNSSHIHQSVILSGWVHNRRDHGGIVFIDLRDFQGTTQIVFDPKQKESFAIADSLRAEYVIQVHGTVVARPEGTINTDMTTGEIEVEATEVRILSRSKPLPFPVDEHHTVSEEVRLKYRFLDLRRPDMQSNIRKRAKVINAIRSYLDAENFIDIETPMLIKATPEGARDYLVPSRTYPGHFFALPQSPQLFKQLLMMSGFDRYYQVARCFRDEDLRSDRQPEFTQIDIETSFLEEEQIMSITEDMLCKVFAQVGIHLPKFTTMTYADALNRFGTDKPDLRLDYELIEVSDVMRDVDFSIFRNPANNPKSRVAMLCMPAANISRKDIDNLTSYVSRFGAKGLAYIKVLENNELQSPILKFLPEETQQTLLQRSGAKIGDILFFGADSSKVVNEALGNLRLHLGAQLGLIRDEWKPLWVTHFPMFEYDNTGKLTPLHHPFTAPACSLEQLKKDPENALSRAYDVVLNGSEIGGGSIRIHDSKVQSEILHLLQISSTEAQEKFGFLLNALDYGCPPHGGIALGFDRIMMHICKQQSIRDVIAFPKTQTASCLLTEAPGYASDEHLYELKLQRQLDLDT